MMNQACFFFVFFFNYGDILNLLYWREVGCNVLQITIEMEP